MSRFPLAVFIVYGISPGTLHRFLDCDGESTEGSGNGHGRGFDSWAGAVANVAESGRRAAERSCQLKEGLWAK